MKRFLNPSRAIAELAYSEESQTLEVVWRSGGDRRYRFFEVPPEVFSWLMNQPSKGGFIHRKVIGHYREERVAENEGLTSVDDELLANLERSVSAVGTTPPPPATSGEEE